MFFANLRKKQLWLFALLCLIFIGAANTAAPNNSASLTIHFSWWCVAGGYAAVILKNLYDALKYYFEGKFNFWLMLLPLVVNVLVATPFVIGIITLLKMPSDSVLGNVVFSFTSVYTIMDGVWFLLKVSGVVKKFAEKKTKEKNKKNKQKK